MRALCCQTPGRRVTSSRRLQSAAQPGLDVTDVAKRDALCCVLKVIRVDGGMKDGRMETPEFHSVSFFTCIVVLCLISHSVQCVHTDTHVKLTCPARWHACRRPIYCSRQHGCVCQRSGRMSGAARQRVREFLRLKRSVVSPRLAEGEVGSW